jgi:hypothetical protein
MSKNELERLAELASEYINKGQRRGQAYMNALRFIRPDLYDKLTGSVDDCFYRDDRLDGFFDALERES